jgi:phage shock protein E
MQVAAERLPARGQLPGRQSPVTPQVTKRGINPVSANYFLTRINKFDTMYIFKQLFGSSEPVDLQNIKLERAFLVDVRTPGEFAMSQVKDSVNIPLDTLPYSLTRFQGKKNIVVFCRSGNRSRQAKAILQQHGFSDVADGGTLDNVNRY